MKTPQNIVLVGFMGSGKSAVGRALAANLGWQLIDTDALIEELAGCSVADIFEREGEPAFRRMERELLASLAKERGAVIATGGGIVLSEQNWALLRALGPVVALAADVDTILKRVRSARTRRPLLEVSDPRAQIERLQEQRAPHYAKADLTIETGDHNPDEVAARILEELGLRRAAGD